MATDVSTPTAFNQPAPLIRYEQVAPPAFQEEYRLRMRDYVSQAPNPDKVRATSVVIALPADSTLTAADRAIPVATVDVSQLKVGGDQRAAASAHAVAKAVGVKITDQNAVKVRAARAEMPVRHHHKAHHQAKPQRSAAVERYLQKREAMENADPRQYGVNRANVQPRDTSAPARFLMACARFSGQATA